MARISTGKTSAAKGKPVAKSPAVHAKPKAATFASRKNGTDTAQVKAAATKKPPVSPRPTSAKAGSAKTESAKAATGKRPVAAQKTEVPKPSGHRKQGAVHDIRITQPSSTATTLPVKTMAKTRKPAPKRSKKITSPPETPPTPVAKAPSAARAATKTIAVKTAAPRRPAARTTVPTLATRRARSASLPRKPAPPQKITATTPQTFTVSHLNQGDFKADGLRTYAHYRDLGIAAATGGLCQAHVIRFIPPCTDEVRKRHLHKADLQLIYVLQGWMKNEFEGHGQQMMSAGSCWLQPSGIKHTVLDYSADCEVLEIIIPADFETQEHP